MPVLLAVLKILAILLAILLVLLITALLLPLGFSIEYRPSRFRMTAIYGPLRRTIWSHRIRRQGISRKPPAEKAKTVTADHVEAWNPPPAADSAAADIPKKEEASRSMDVPAGKKADEKLPEAAAPEEEEEELPSGVMGRLERMLSLLEEDPKALAHCVFGHVRWLHRHSVFKMSISHADVYWTVTCEDAAATAIAYGAEMAALNTVLALIQQTVRLQSDRLWLEPDFMGAKHDERRIACTVSASAVLMLHLLYRIWKDPLLQPQEQPEPQKI